MKEIPSQKQNSEPAPTYSQELRDIRNMLFFGSAGGSLMLIYCTLIGVDSVNTLVALAGGAAGGALIGLPVGRRVKI